MVLTDKYRVSLTRSSDREKVWMWNLSYDGLQNGFRSLNKNLSSVAKVGDNNLRGFQLKTDLKSGCLPALVNPGLTCYVRG